MENYVIKLPVAGFIVYYPYAGISSKIQNSAGHWTSNRYVGTPGIASAAAIPTKISFA